MISLIKGDDSIGMAAVDGLLKDIFNFSLKPFIDLGFWDERYESYSIQEKGRVISNVCLYKTDLTVLGRQVRAHQFGAVATRPEARGQGLSRLLMQHVLEKYPTTPTYLAANENVVDFYPRFGFEEVQTFRAVLDTNIHNPKAKAAAKRPSDETIREAVLNNQLHSTLLDCRNTQPLQLMQLLTNERHKNNVFHLPECGAVVNLHYNAHTLFINEVFAPRQVSFEALARELPATDVKQVKFGFNPDKLGVDVRWEALDDPYFVRGNWNFPTFFRFPILSET